MLFKNEFSILFTRTSWLNWYARMFSYINWENNLLGQILSSLRTWPMSSWGKYLSTQQKMFSFEDLIYSDVVFFSLVNWCFSCYLCLSKYNVLRWIYTGTISGLIAGKKQIWHLISIFSSFSFLSVLIKNFWTFFFFSLISQSIIWSITYMQEFFFLIDL